MGLNQSQRIIHKVHLDWSSQIQSVRTILEDEAITLADRGLDFLA